MDQSISIPVSLVLRSLPVNFEILDLLKSPLNFSNISEIESWPNKREFKTLQKSVVAKQSNDSQNHEEKRPLQKMKKGVQVSRTLKNIK